MFQVRTTPEYDKCLVTIRTRGKIGKEAYRTALVAEAEAHKGDIQTVPRTHHGENRLPDAEKYDLPGDYRLVIQRVKGKEPATIFRFVGDHNETERWLDNRAGEALQTKRKPKAVPDPREQFEEEKQRLEQKQRELEEMMGILEQENGQLNTNLLDSKREVEKQKAGVEKAAKKQEQLEAEIAQLARERDVLVAKHEQLAIEKDESVGAARREEERELASKLARLQEANKRHEENRRQLILSREQLIDVQKQFEEGRERLGQTLQVRDEQLVMFKERIRRLQNQIDKGPAPEVIVDGKFWLWPFLIACGLILVLIVIVSIVLSSSARPPSTPPNRNKESDRGPVIPREPPEEKNVRAGDVATPPEPPRVEAPVEKPPVGPAATEKQMAYVAGLVRRKGWSEKERDAEINKVLGYARSHQNLTKREASSLIDAWK